MIIMSNKYRILIRRSEALNQNATVFFVIRLEKRDTCHWSILSIGTGGSRSFKLLRRRQARVYKVDSLFMGNGRQGKDKESKI